MYTVDFHFSRPVSSICFFLQQMNDISMQGPRIIMREAWIHPETAHILYLFCRQKQKMRIGRTLYLHMIFVPFMLVRHVLKCDQGACVCDSPALRYCHSASKRKCFSYGKRRLTQPTGRFKTSTLDKVH